MAPFDGSLPHPENPEVVPTAARARRAVDVFDLDRIISEIAGIQGRLALLGSRDAYENATNAAQVLGALRAALANPTSQATRSLKRAERSIRQAVGGDRPSTPDFLNESRSAEEAKAILLEVITSSPKTGDEGLARHLDVARLLFSAQSWLGNHEGGDGPTMARWAKKIRNVRATKRKWEPEELARAVILAIAKAEDHPNPNALFDAERQRKRRTAKRTRPGA